MKGKGTTWDQSVVIINNWETWYSCLPMEWLNDLKKEPATRSLLTGGNRRIIIITETDIYSEKEHEQLLFICRSVFMTNLKKILIVEDDEIIASLIERILKKKDYTIVAKVTTGEEALNRTADLGPDLVLMDITLKGAIDGIDAARYINSIFNIPVVFLTGSYDDETIERAKMAEPMGFITKPFNDRDLYSNIEIALYSHAMRKRALNIKGGGVKSIMAALDAVIMTDMKGRIFFMNPYAEQLINVSYRQAIMHSINKIFILIDIRTGQPIEDPIYEVVKESMVIGIENNLAMITNDKKKRHITLSARPIRDSRDEVIAVFVKIHARTQSERKLFAT